MKLTSEQLRQNAAAMIAFADGKPIQFRRIGASEWVVERQCDPPHYEWDCSSYEYRPKPTPATRPWSKPEDVPGPVCWIAPLLPSGYRGLETMIIAFGIGFFVTYSCHGECTSHNYKDIDHHVFSTDRKTWHPCVVTEEAP